LRPETLKLEEPMPRIDEDRRLAVRSVSREEIRTAAERLASRHPEVEALWLFGSYVRDEQRPTSDVDIAVMTRRDLAHDFRHSADLALAAEELLGVPTDVVLLHADLPLPLLWEILSRPLLLWARDAEDAAAFASGLRALVRDDWPRLERRWARAREWFLEGASATDLNG
jgi:predicted nucleotidyltransferase